MTRCLLKMLLLAALPFTSIAGAEPGTQSVFSSQAGECTLSLEAASQTLRLRVQHPRHQSCPITVQDMQAMLTAAMAEIPKSAGNSHYTSLALGRLIDYPWLSSYLAQTALQDRQWNKQKGKSLSGDINAYVARILSSAEVLRQFQPALGRSGYQVTAVSVEKVLVGGVENVPFYPGKKAHGHIPFDAQVRLRLQYH